MTLEGVNTSRKVQLAVSVDGTASSALAVMSQGELNALALSVFLPRALLPESPFRFLVIDDPVQAMDPAKVDGLAFVLRDAAKTRQVVVFTHDDRLPAAVRRLGIDAVIQEVTRGDKSTLTIRAVSSPPVRHWLDADAVLLDQHVSDAVARRVVPGILRVALEAACRQHVRKHRLVAGARHTDVEQLLIEVDTLNKLMALTLFDDLGRISDVPQRLRVNYGPWAESLVRDLNKGAHGSSNASRKFLRDTLGHDTKRLIQALGEWQE